MTKCRKCSQKCDQSGHERWLPVVGLEGFVEVSDHGRLRSLDRVIHLPASGAKSPHQRIHRGKILAQTKHSAGYMYVTISGGGKLLRNRKVHHLVLEAFMGARPEGMECRHLNDIADDNHVENLRWGTRSENIEDRVNNGGGLKTHCIHGHEYTPENTVILRNPKGAKRCRTCTNERRARR
ncbi:NUMOD4 motif-containing HNH endonuclease [Mycobacteroides salmoniphilum]|uniref:NUMOD4 motif-containing HNH endonuclease n=1 Tax=Mycobacteroides salmoniphilum TaxID=404941 RepID=UPI000991B234